MKLLVMLLVLFGGYFLYQKKHKNKETCELRVKARQKGPDLCIEHHGFPLSSKLGEPLRFSVKVVNIGTTAAESVKLQEKLFNSRFIEANNAHGAVENLATDIVQLNFGTIPPNAEKKAEIVIKPFAAGKLVITAKVEPEMNDLNITNNEIITRITQIERTASDASTEQFLSLRAKCEAQVGADKEKLRKCMIDSKNKSE